MTGPTDTSSIPTRPGGAPSDDPFGGGRIGPDRRWLLALVGIAVIAGLVGWFAFTGSDDDGDEEAGRRTDTEGETSGGDGEGPSSPSGKLATTPVSWDRVVVGVGSTLHTFDPAGRPIAEIDVGFEADLVDVVAPPYVWVRSADLSEGAFVDLSDGTVTPVDIADESAAATNALTPIETGAGPIVLGEHALYRPGADALDLTDVAGDEVFQTMVSPDGTRLALDSADDTVVVVTDLDASDPTTHEIEATLVVVGYDTTLVLTGRTGDDYEYATVDADGTEVASFETGFALTAAADGDGFVLGIEDGRVVRVAADGEIVDEIASAFPSEESPVITFDERENGTIVRAAAITDGGVQSVRFFDGDGAWTDSIDSDAGTVVLTGGPGACIAVVRPEKVELFDFDTMDLIAETTYADETVPTFGGADGDPATDDSCTIAGPASSRDDVLLTRDGVVALAPDGTTVHAEVLSVDGTEVVSRDDGKELRISSVPSLAAGEDATVTFDLPDDTPDHTPIVLVATDAA